MCSMLKVFATVVFIVLVEGNFMRCHASQGETENERKDYKLPNNTSIEKYHLNLHTNIHLGNPFFSASVNIKIKVLEDMDMIELHSVNLNVSNIIVLRKRKTGIKYELDESKEIIKINLPLTKNETLELKIEYEGSFTDDFIIKEFESDFLLLSFQAIGFRTICPSRDEYGVKSTFEIEIEHDTSYNAISNSEVEATNEIDRNSVTKFFETKLIPKSSLAIFVSNLEPISLNDGVLYINIYGNQTEFYQYALERAIDIMKVSNSFFNTSHYISSFKVVALPSTVSMISTLNLMILNQHQITFQSEESTTMQKNKILRVFTRGIAQQYFGNALTMFQKSFLVEGLAMFFDYFFANKLKNENEIPDTFNINVLQPALETDSLLIAKPLTEMNEEKSDEIFEFRAQKTSSILRMFQNVYGEENFITLINDFISKYKFDSLTLEDFIIQFEDYNTFFTSWFMNTGYPLVTVSRKSSTHIKLTQRRFFLYNFENCSNELWKIPITYLTSNDDNDSNEIIWMNDKEKLIPIESDWFILNVNQIGFYRVNYHPESMWLQLIRVLKDDFKKIPILNRAALIDDAMNLAFAGKLSYETFFHLLTYLKHEDELIVWKSAHEILSFLDMMLSSDEKLYEQFKKFVSEIIDSIYEKYGNDVEENENFAAKEMRKIAIYWACKAEIKTCITFVNESVQNFENLDKDLKFVVLCNAIRISDVETFNEYFDKINEIIDENREQLIYALACSENDESLIKLIMTSSISDYDKRHVLIATTTNYKYGAMAVKKLFETYAIEFSKAESEFMLNKMTKRMWNKEWSNVINFLNALKDFEILTENEVITYNHMMNTTVDWLINNEEEISNWFDNYFKENYSTTELTKTETKTTTTQSTTTDNGNRLNFNFILVPFIFLIKYLL
ncbi:hypothetical protein PVAND_007810 [Polypedilum vanderplanki]|uniref:Aminopeptidase n=1 Tax=Polypedilum vanderplanki TaxID=319348 RepID=A0A9J6C842_POLVA|nr:hypothetical protein PVAND_007810 [Polypedilum vanderplanki]